MLSAELGNGNWIPGRPCAEEALLRRADSAQPNPKGAQASAWSAPTNSPRMETRLPAASIILHRQRIEDSMQSSPRHLLQYVTGRAAGKRHNETPTVRKTPPLPLRSKLRKLQPQVSYQVCPRLSRPPCGRGSLAVSRCEETCCSLRRVSMRSLELFQPFGNVSSGIFKMPGVSPDAANYILPRRIAALIKQHLHFQVCIHVSPH